MTGKYDIILYNNKIHYSPRTVAKMLHFREMVYLTKRCSAAAELWPGGWSGPHFFDMKYI